MSIEQLKELYKESTGSVKADALITQVTESAKKGHTAYRVADTFKDSDFEKARKILQEKFGLGIQVSKEWGFIVVAGWEK